MELSLALCLPRDAATVPVTRKILRCALQALAVTAPVRDDIELALTEACDNVIMHAQHGEEYAVRIGVNGAVCAIDTGRGWDAATIATIGLPDGTAEHGRGLHLIHTLTENVQLANHPKQGAMVHFEKHLEWLPNAPLPPP